MISTNFSKLTCLPWLNLWKSSSAVFIVKDSEFIMFNSVHINLNRLWSKNVWFQWSNDEYLINIDRSWVKVSRPISAIIIEDFEFLDIRDEGLEEVSGRERVLGEARGEPA
mmetsp:Transcript_16349/g.16294  ORF Transcript_16349/g.16294 Transcript_16349/m.16294 type:complete len:111 (-) Transcript_16349:282-614(-)